MSTLKKLWDNSRQAISLANTVGELRNGDLNAEETLAAHITPEGQLVIRQKYFSPAEAELLYTYIGKVLGK